MHLASDIVVGRYARDISRHMALSLRNAIMAVELNEPLGGAVLIEGSDGPTTVRRFRRPPSKMRRSRADRHVPNRRG